MPTFHCEIPPSVNHLYVRGLRFSKKGRAYSGLKLSDEAVTWKDGLLLQVNQWRAKYPTLTAALRPPYQVCVSLVLPSKGRRDADNVLKLLIDTLAVGFGFDDKDVLRLEVTKHYDDHHQAECLVCVDTWNEKRE